MNEELITYVLRELERGVEREDIRKALTLQGGWSEADVNGAFFSIDQTKNASIPIAPQQAQGVSSENRGSLYIAPEDLSKTPYESVETPPPAVSQNESNQNEGKVIFTNARLAAGSALFFVLFFASMIISFSSGNQSLEQIADSSLPVDFDQTELVDYIRPSVVSIISHVTGEVAIRPFKIDLIDLKILSGDFDEESATIDEYGTGSGFIVNPNGYILTNSHVVGTEAYEEEFIVAFTLAMIDISYTSLLFDPRMEGKKEEDLPSEQEYIAFFEEVYEHVKNTMRLKLEVQAYVANTDSRGASFPEIVKDAFPAEMVYVNKNLIEDQKDIALIRITQEDLPSVSITQKSKISAGDDAYVFGFPASATFNRASIFKPSFTKGAISSVKRSDNNDFDIYQLDAKISAGSSGGPVMDENGDVVGVITWQSGITDIGDTFAFALPISFGADVLEDHNIDNEKGAYNERFERAVRLARANRCVAAIAEFEAAEAETNRAFLERSHLDGQMERCESMIASGKSVDGKSAEFGEWVKSRSFAPWYVALGFFFVVLLALLGFRSLSRKIRDNSQRISSL